MALMMSHPMMAASMAVFAWQYIASRANMPPEPADLGDDIVAEELDAAWHAQRDKRMAVRGRAIGWYCVSAALFVIDCVAT